MTTSSATVLRRREPPGGASRPTQSGLPVLGGYTPDGEPAAAVFFWAATRFPDDFEYVLHRHEGLEILTLVLQATMGHYDTATGQWAYLNAGDAQLIRSGSGVSHIERGTSGTRGFQIQFDPDYAAALKQEPSYTDYPAASFTAHLIGDALVTELVGDAGPIHARTERLSVRRVAVSVVTSLVNRAVIGLTGSALGLMSVILLLAHGSPSIGAGITVLQLSGYIGLFLSITVMLRVIVGILRPREH